MKIFELVPRYDTRKSFYGKARVVDHEDGTINSLNAKNFLGRIKK